MGDTQSAQRAGKKDAEEEEEESAKVNDVQTVEDTEDKPLKTNGQISEINGKADGSIAALNGHCKDEISAEDKDVAKTEKSPKEEKTPVESVDINAKTSPDEADANEVEKVEIIEMEEKQNDINESFRNFFSNIGLKLTVKKGSGEKAETDVPEEVPNIPEEIKDNAQEVKSENEEQSVDLNTAQEANEYDSTTCPSLTDGISENIPENADIKETETKEEAEHDNDDARTTSPAVNEDGHQDTTQELHPASPMITEEKVAESPLKRFFTTGIFSSLRKKKKLAEDEVTEKELVDMGENEIAEIAEQAVEEQDKEEITLDTEAATTEKGLGEVKIVPAVTTQDNVKPPSMERSDGEGEMLNSQEKEKVQASPLKKLMSGSSFRSLSKKQKAKKSSDTKITDSQEQVSDQLLSSTESAENQKDESPAQPSAPAAEEEDSAWAAFKKLLTPKKRNKTPSLSNEQAQISGSVDEAKPSEGEQISDHSTEEGKKRKDSSVSWEAVLCGSGRRKSRKSSDSEEETSQNSKQDSGLKQGAESPLERSNEAQEIKEGSPPESDGESTWKSFKKLVTPKTKAKDLDESKDIIPSDNEVTQAESTFSIKNLLPGRKKRKPAETLEQVSLDEADKEASDDEDSETPAVIPLSEFADEMGETKADVESYIPEVTDNEVHLDSTPPCDSLPLETQTSQDNEEALENEVPKTLATPAPVEEPDDLTESISKHQQLSDIPEEGVLTETMATPASGIEEAARDDTIAEDLVEITSEAITAPEPVDITVTDETEMISAVSQLSDSSKTSGNATPVPVEYSVNNIELLLEQVAETISVSTHVVPVTLEQPSSERIVSSVSPQLLETFEKEQPKILEIHKGSDETVVNAELNAEPIDAINELEATAQTESIPDVNKAVSTEIVSEIVSEETDNAEVTEDEVHEVSVTQMQESIKELEVTDDSQHVLECISEEKEELPQETLPEGDEVAPDKGSLVVADQVEEDTSKTETQEAESALFEADETKDGSIKQEAQSSCSTGDQINQNITEQSQIEAEPSLVVDELEALANVEKDVKASEEDTIQSLEEEALSLEDIPPREIVTDDSKQTEHLAEVTVEPEDRQTQAEAPKTDDHEVKDVVEVEQKATATAEEDKVQSPEEEAPSSEDVPPAESIDEFKPIGEHLTEDEVSIEPETKETQSEVSEVTEVPEGIQATTLQSEEDRIQEEIQSSQDIQSAEPVTDESKHTGEHLTEVTDEPETKEPQSEVSEVTEVPEGIQATTLQSEEDRIQEEIQPSQDIQAAEPVTDESKQTSEHLSQGEVSNEPEIKEPQPEVSKVTEVSEGVQATTLESKEDNFQEEIQPSQDIQSAEPVIYEYKYTGEHLTEGEVSNEPEIKEPQPEVSEVTEVSEGVQATTLESEEDGVQTEIQPSEGIRSAEPVTDESKELAENLIEVTDEIKKKEPQPEVSEVPEVPKVLQATSLHSEEDSVQTEIQPSEDIRSAEPVTDEYKQTTQHPTEVTDEIQNKESLPEVPEKVEAVQVVTLDLEEGSGESWDKEVISEDVPPAEKDQPQEAKMVPITEDKGEALDDSITKAVLQVVQAVTLDSEEGQPQGIEDEVISKDMGAMETVTGEPKQKAVDLMEPEASLPDAEDNVSATDREAFKSANAVASSVQVFSTQELETETLLEDVPKPDTDSITDETEKKQPDQDLEINKDQVTESIPQNDQAEHEDRKAEAVDETVTAAYVPSVEEEEKEASNDQVHEETCVDSAEASEEPKYDEDVSTAQVSVEGEKADELQGTKVITAATEHAVVMQVITCNLKDVSAVIPDVLIEETTEIREHLIERKASEMEVKDTFETTTPLEKNNVINTAEEGSVVVMMHVPSQEFDNNHRFQVQVVDVDINSAENIVNTMIEVGVTEAKEVIDVCHETLEKVENLSASTAIEEEVNNEENNLTVQEVIQHVKENLPEPTPESVPDELEQEVIKQPDVSETVQSASSEPEDEKMMKDSSGELMEEEDEGHGIPAEQKESEDQLKTSDLGLDISTHDHKEDLEETKAEQQKSEVCVTAEDATALSEELAKKKDGDTTTEAQRPQSTQSQIVTPNNTGLVAPQNTGMISSIGNVESPSSLSLEFKLNIQFGQLKAPASPPPPAEPVKQLNVSEVAVQAVEAVEPTNLINAMQRVESEKQMELMEVAVQTTEITESEAVVSHPPKLQDAAVQEMETTQPAEQAESKEPIISKIQAAETTKPLKQITEPAEKLDLTERSMISKQPVLEAVSIQTIETIEPVEQIQSKQSIIPDIQATQTTEPVMQKEKRGLLISHPAVFKARSKEKTAEEPIKQIEEENDDVWLDAEEDIYTQEEKGASHIQVEEPTEPQAGSAHEEKEDPESEFEMAPDTKSEDEESHQRVHETGGTGEIESEGEDFAVALEYPVITTCVTQAEWD
ncbi:titin [Oreochromis niloticus]|uniref:titin n=1 Tax=Oreochromis niloticus TaxID=8128 RepID=UPI00039403B7|nr:titin [Oreochromis niloticus]